jgi:mannitol-specific phosphotransferase system IIBC component
MIKNIFLSNNKYEIIKQGKRIFVNFKDPNSTDKIIINEKDKNLIYFTVLIVILIFFIVFFLCSKILIIFFKKSKNNNSTSLPDSQVNQFEKNDQVQNSQKDQSDKDCQIIEVDNTKKICLSKSKEINIKTISYGLNLLADVAEGLMINEEKQSNNSNGYYTRSKKKAELNF